MSSVHFLLGTTTSTESGRRSESKSNEKSWNTTKPTRTKIMTKVTMAPGFVSAEVKSMPKNVRFLDEAPDGAYITVTAQRAERSLASNNYRAKKAIPSGALIIVTENGHLYTLNGNAGLVGLGKNQRSAYAQLMVQRVSMAVTVNDYRPRPKKKKVEKKVAKKKRMTKKKR